VKNIVAVNGTVVRDAARFRDAFSEEPEVTSVFSSLAC
jgi:hypothetical protein